MSPEQQQETRPHLNRAAWRKLLYRPGKVNPDNYPKGIVAKHNDEKVLRIQQAAEAIEKKSRLVPCVPCVAYFGESHLQYANMIARELTNAQETERRGKKSKVRLRYEIPAGIPEDFFDREFGRVSLSDIEKMGQIQSEDDFERIKNFWFHLGSQAVVNRKGARAYQYLMATLIAHPLVRPDSLQTLHPRLMHLRQNLLPVFDYFSDFMLNFSADTETDYDMARLGINLGQIGYFYTLETSGLALSSMQKLIIQRSKQLKRRSFFWSLIDKTTAGRLANRLGHARNGQKEDVDWQYLTFDQETDKQAARQLVKHYGPTLSEPQNLSEEFERAKDIHDKWRKYQQAFSKRLAKKPIEFDNFGHPLVNKVMLSARSQKSTHLVLFMGEDVHLTLDYDHKGRLFGLPADLAIKYPHIDKLVISDLISALLPKLASMYPNIADKIEAEAMPPSQKTQTVTLTPSQSVITTDSKPKDPEKIAAPNKPPKRKTLRAAGLITDDKTELTEEVQARVSQVEPIRIVDYSDDKLKGVVGGRIHSIDLNRIMNTIRRFEFGWIDAEPLNVAAYGLSGARLFELRTGRWRVILEQDSNFFGLVDIFRHNSNKYYKRLGQKVVKN